MLIVSPMRGYKNAVDFKRKTLNIRKIKILNYYLGKFIQIIIL
jgi:hypothetical protein